MELCGRVGDDTWMKSSNFGGDPDTVVVSGSLSDSLALGDIKCIVLHSPRDISVLGGRSISLIIIIIIIMTQSVQP